MSHLVPQVFRRYGAAKSYLDLSEHSFTWEEKKWICQQIQSTGIPDDVIGRCLNINEIHARYNILHYDIQIWLDTLDKLYDVNGEHVNDFDDIFTLIELDYNEKLQNINDLPLDEISVCNIQKFIQNHRDSSSAEREIADVTKSPSYFMLLSDLLTEELMESEKRCIYRNMLLEMTKNDSSDDEDDSADEHDDLENTDIAFPAST